VKSRSIDDVPVLAFTLWSERYSGYELRRVAQELSTTLKQDAEASEVTVIGGQRRQVRVTLDPARLRAYGASPLAIMGSIKQANVVLPSGSFQEGGHDYLVETGGFLASAEDMGSVVIGMSAGRPVYLRDVAEVIDGPEEPTDYVFMGFGPAAEHTTGHVPGGYSAVAQYEAVTLALSKKQGANATLVAERAIEKIAALRGTIIPEGMELTVTRNYGETAREKSDELLKHMAIATISVIILMALFLGWRESIVVAVAVPVTLALTLLVTYLYGYTLNRVTLFALIFSIGILVDDAIVVVENIHRHFKLGRPGTLAAVFAVDEVGNPTILATFTVIAALMPMAFVSGLMGPYMRPIPVGASAAMMFSLLVAFIVSPWLSYIVLKKIDHGEGHEEGKDKLGLLYGRIITPMVERKRLRYGSLAVVGLLLALSVALVPLKGVTVKMLPFDNKSEIQIIIDMPEGSTLEDTAALTRELGEHLKTVPEVLDYQSYVGTSAPFNFNGLVRHYFLRRGNNMADIQVNFVPKHERTAQSHDIAKRLRPTLDRIATAYGARIKVAEIPPGPPVLGTLVAEIYGPDTAGQVDLARRVKEIFETTDGVVDVDWYVEEDQTRITFEVDKIKAAASGVSTEAVAQTLRVALAGMSAGLAHMPVEKEPVEIFLRLPIEERSGIEALTELTVPSATGEAIPLSELVRVRTGRADQTIYHKNLKRVTYVTGDVAGTEESPVYAILKMKDRVGALTAGHGAGQYAIEQHFSEQPELENRYALKWDGEMHITYEVFRDLGVAFAAVLVLIYVLVVAWFKSFTVPLVIMAPIPLTLVGILPGHWALGAFFTATSMIGFIALSGIIVRNSILLVDFIQSEWRDTGDLKHALVKAGAVRFRPIVLTAAAVVVGSFVMLFDPIFEGLAIAMMFGAVAATALTLVAVPLVYYELFKQSPAPVCEAEAKPEEEPE
jgi:multidrug efflux pump subunit AcrB